jgi:hypothetical protein
VELYWLNTSALLLGSAARIAASSLISACTHATYATQQMKKVQQAIGCRQQHQHLAAGVRGTHRRQLSQ